MNILFFQNLLSPSSGGVARVTSVLSRNFEDKNHICFFCSYGKEINSFYDEKKCFFYKSDKEFVDFCQDKRIDVIINQTSRDRNVFAAFKRLRKINSKIKIVSVLHTSPSYCNMDYKINLPIDRTTITIHIKYFIARLLQYLYNYRRIEMKMLYDNSDILLLLSNRYIEEFKKICNIETSSKLAAIANPFPFTKDTNMDHSPKSKTVLIVGRMVEGQKRIFDAIEIWDRTKKKYPDFDWILKIVGDGPHLNYYMSYVKKHKIKDIVFEGSQSDVSKYYEEANIFMMTSIWEGLPMTIIEALQYQCVPIVFNTFEAAKDIVENGLNGYLIEKNNTESFCDTLYSLSKNTQKIDEMGREGLNILHKFNPNIIINEWINLLTQ